MNKRERLEKTIAGETIDRPPVALWRHWAGDDQRSADLARSHIQFMQDFDWDFLAVVPSRHYMVVDYGLQDIWQGNQVGHREVLRTPVQRSLHWTELRPLDPNRGQFAKQLQCLQMISNALANGTPLLQVVQSPLTQALYLGGHDLLFRTMRTQADRLKTGLNSITETTLRYLEGLNRNTQIDGILYVTDLASYTMMSEAEYAEFGLPYDTKVMDALPDKWWLNILQTNGSVPMLHLFVNLPVQVMNWSTVEARPSLDRIQLEFRGAYCGGVGEETHMHLGTPSIVRDAVREAIQSGNRRLIVGTGTTIPMTTPRSNIQAVRDAVNIRSTH